MSSLDSINYNELSEEDQYFYDLLKIKAADKAYIFHTTDSVILRVIDYYSTHDKRKLYPEALYYGGRVYNDLGDSPTALQYFHKALDNIPDKNADLDLKTRILSQTGRLLNDLRLYEEAIPYINEALEIEADMGDTISLVYDYQLLGSTYLRDEQYNKAESCFNKAISLSTDLPISFVARSQQYLAQIKYKKGQLDSARNLIRTSVDLVTPSARNNALSTATRIYLQSELLDSAYIYAYELIHSQDPTNKGTGYRTLLAPQLKDMIPLDTIYQYISDYRGLMEDFYNFNKVQSAINQQNLYNYQTHEIKRQKAEADNRRLIWWVFGISSFCFILIIIVLYYKNKTKKTLIELHVALENANRLNRNINDLSQSASMTEADSDNSENHPLDDNTADNSIKSFLLTSNAEKELRENLRRELMALYNNNTSSTLSKVIYDSEAYKRLQELINRKQILSPDAPLWDELEAVVLKASPKFKDNLHLLTQSQLTSIDLHTALLIKCHVQPSQMSVLLSRSKGAIVSRRETLCYKIFGEKLGTKVIDGIIRLL